MRMCQAMALLWPKRWFKHQPSYLDSRSLHVLVRSLLAVHRADDATALVLHSLKAGSDPHPGGPPKIDRASEKTCAILIRRLGAHENGLLRVHPLLLSMAQAGVPLSGRTTDALELVVRHSTADSAGVALRRRREAASIQRPVHPGDTDSHFASNPVEGRNSASAGSARRKAQRLTSILREMQAIGHMVPAESSVETQMLGARSDAD